MVTMVTLSMQNLLWLIKKRSGLGYFWNNLRKEAASELRFSPFERGQWWMSIYARIHELTNGQCWSACDGHFENAVIILVSDRLRSQIRPFDRKSCSLSIFARPRSPAYSVQELFVFAESPEIGQVPFNNPKMGQGMGN